MSGEVASDYGGPPAPRPTSWPLEPGTAAARYAALEGTRMPYQFRAIRFASLTLPNLFRIIGANGTTDEITAWQSFGGYCVNNLVSKLMLSIFPPGIPFIRIKPSRKTVKSFAQLDPTHAGQLKTEIEKALSMTEQEFVDGVAEDGDAATQTLGLKNLIVGGNYGFHFQHDGTIRGIPFVHYVNVRDKAGNLIEFCVRDAMMRETLPGDVKQMLKQHASSVGKDASPGLDQAEVNLFTYGRRMNGLWHVHQECEQQIVSTTQWTYTDDALPFVFVPFNLLDGEHYGRAYVEDFEGDLQTLDGLEQSITEGTAAAARYITLVKPGGVTNRRILAEAQNGDVIPGDPEDVHTVDSNKNQDFQAGISRIEAKEARIAKAFLLQESTVRNAERVTTEEIRWTAQQLQDSLGGLYTQLVPNLQTPYAKRKMMALQRNGRMTYLPRGTTKVVLVTGAAALGRNTELQNLEALVSPQSQAAQAAAQKVINWQSFYSRRAIALGVDQDNLVLTQEELDSQQQQEQSTAMMQRMGPDAIRAGAGMMQEGMKQSGAAQQQQTQIAADQQAAANQQQAPAQGQ